MLVDGQSDSLSWWQALIWDQRLDFHCRYFRVDGLCGLVVKISSYGSHSRRYQTFWVVGLENPECGHKDPSRWPRDNLYPKRLPLTSLTSGGRSPSLTRRQFYHFQLLLPIDSIFALWPESHGSHDLFYCFRLDSPQPAGPGPHIYIPRNTVVYFYRRSNGFHFHCLLRLSGILRMNSNHLQPEVNAARSRSYLTTDGQSVSMSCCREPLWICDHILLPVGMLLSEICGLASVGRGERPGLHFAVQSFSDPSSAEPVTIVRVRVTLRLTVSQYVLASSPLYGRLTRYCFLFKCLGLEFVVLSLWGALSDDRLGLSFVSHSPAICLYIYYLHFCLSHLYHMLTDRSYNISLRTA
jgi:hypothetical protein